MPWPPPTRPPGSGTQGHVLTVADLASDLVVEATVHLLDLTVDLDGAPDPPPAALAEARRVLEGLHGAPLPARWDDTEAVLEGTGRVARSTDDDRAASRRTVTGRSRCIAVRSPAARRVRGRACSPARAR